MERGWRLEGRWFAAVREVEVPEGAPGCAWWIVRQGGEGPRHLLQVWDPLPPPKVLDAIREDFLRRFTQAEPLDPGPCRMGFDDKTAWCLQALEGTPFIRLWEAEDRSGRESLAAALLEASGRSRAPRLFLPEVVGVLRGRILAPRRFGPAPWAPEGVPPLPDLPPGPGGGPRPWEQAPDLTDPVRCPIRGRAQELTYLKSLMFGLRSPVAMERVIVLQGEEGLGQDQLADWCACAARTEGLWVSDLEILPGETPGGFYERLLQDALTGLEADLYAAEPSLARALSRRLPTYAFLRGGRHPAARERPLVAAEVEAALGALAFAHERHPRLCLVRGMERLTPGVLEALKGVVGRSAIPWLLSFRDPGSCPGLKAHLERLADGPASASLVLDRLEDEGLADVLDDLLGPRDLPRDLEARAVAAALGNPGLLRGFLESAIHRGGLVWAGGRWTLGPGGLPPMDEPEGRAEGILAARLDRLEPASLAAVRILALADAPLDLAALARALGLDAEGAEEALHAASSLRLAVGADGLFRTAGPRVRDLALAGADPGEARRLAKALLKAVEREGRRTLLSVRLKAYLQDRPAALALVFAALERDRPGPQEARTLVDEALGLEPDARQRSRLWEALSDAWRAGPWPEAAAGPSPHAQALEAVEEALRALGEPPPGSEEEEIAARCLRKRADLEIRLRRFPEAHRSIRRAAACLADHPFHPEQPRLRLALACLHEAQGALPKAVKAVEEGLKLLRQKEGAGPGHHDHAALLMEMGRLLAWQAHFQHALATFEGARRLVEHEGDRGRLVRVLEALGGIQACLGQTENARRLLEDALAVARSQDDLEGKAVCHLALGALRSRQEAMGPALAHLESALRRFQALGDGPRAARASAWKARTLAALGDGLQAEHLLLTESLGGLESLPTPMEAGERAFLAGEIAAFREEWPEARRMFLESANRFGDTGCSYEERMARLRLVHAETMAAGPRAPDSAWMHLERLKGLVEGSGSRWLELEWSRCHALLLSRSGSGEGVISEALLAWGAVVALARELGLPARVLEAETWCSGLLLDRGEKLGARSRMQDALPCFQELWARLPAAFEEGFLARSDIHGFRQAAERTGMKFLLPVRGEAGPDWGVTQANLPALPPLWPQT